jgi:DNA-binding response OmpR family regulator
MTAPSHPSSKPAGRRVLVVEDHEDCLSTMVELLAMDGCEVRSARAGKEAIATALEFRPELMFLDLGLPGISGYEVARTLRADSRTAGMLIVAVTGFGTPEVRALARAAGVDLHLVKPVAFQQLHAAVMACGSNDAPGHQAATTGGRAIGRIPS